MDIYECVYLVGCARVRDISHNNEQTWPQWLNIKWIHIICVFWATRTFISFFYDFICLMRVVWWYRWVLTRIQCILWTLFWIDDNKPREKKVTVPYGKMKIDGHSFYFFFIFCTCGLLNTYCRYADSPSFTYLFTLFFACIRV